jgi:hypothetical protein
MISGSSDRNLDLCTALQGGYPSFGVLRTEGTLCFGME